MGLPASVGGAVIEDALADMALYSRMNDAERRAYDLAEERKFAAVYPNIDEAKQAVAALVTKWQAANPALVNALVSRGLFHSARTFGALAMAARRSAVRATLK